MNDEHLNLQIKAFCEKINNVLKKKREFVKKVGIIDDKDISDEDIKNSESSLAEIPLEQNETMGKIDCKTTVRKIDNWDDNIHNNTKAKIKVVNYSKQHNDINSFPDGMPGDIVLNIGCRMRIRYNTDNDTVDFFILDILHKNDKKLLWCPYKKIKVDESVNKDEIKNIIIAMQQKNADIQKFEKRAIKLSNVVQRDPFVESCKRNHFLKYKAQVEALKEKEQKLLSLFNKKIKIQNENTKKYFKRWQNNTRKMSENEICGIDCSVLKCNGKWCGCI